MSNPGPAITVGLHPQNVTSSQALRLLAKVQGINANVAGDNVAQVINSSNFTVKEVFFTNANNAGASANLSDTIAIVRTGAAGTGSNVCVSTTLTNCATNAGVQDASDAITTSFANVTNLYVRVTTASANTGTVDCYVYGYDFSQAQ